MWVWWVLVLELHGLVRASGVCASFTFKLDITSHHWAPSVWKIRSKAEIPVALSQRKRKSQTIQPVTSQKAINRLESICGSGRIWMTYRTQIRDWDSSPSRDLTQQTTLLPVAPTGLSYLQMHGPSSRCLFGTRAHRIVPLRFASDMTKQGCVL